ncbi:TPA: hypothetical protein ENS27_02300 [bacterium]|nr:hypothetical protein [bacterium]
MLQNQLEEGRFCRDCGADLTVICPICHGLGYIQPLPSMSSFSITNCLHANEIGEYCSKCGAKLYQDNMMTTCGTCMGKGWILSQNHYCYKKAFILPNR